MNNKKLFKDLSANTVQTGIAQVAGLLIFYILSKYIAKEEFGAYSWATAVGSTIIAIGSLGLDMVLVRRVAAGEEPKLIAGIHFFHTLLVGLLTMLGVFLFQKISPVFFDARPILLLVIVQLIFANIANSFKFSLTGFEAFRPLAIVSICVHLLKLTILFTLLLTHYLSIENVVYGFIVATLVELVISYFFLGKRLNDLLKPIIARESYKGFIVESLPQLGVVLFDSALARVDWILLGIYSTISITAEYSFAYKFFELSKLPLLILAPVLLTRFSKLFVQNDLPIEAEKQKSIQQFFNIEIFISMLIPIFMVSVWSGLIDWVTDGKYGAVNEMTYTILAICVPLHFVINLFWTMAFVQKQLKTIMYITIGVSLFNLIANIVLIPLYASVGAAIAFLLGTLIQFFCYYFLVKKQRMNIRLKSFLILIFVAIASLLTFKLLLSNSYLIAVCAIVTYVVAAFFLKLISFKKLIG